MILSARHLTLGVALAGTLVPHWWPALRSPHEGPLHYTLGLVVAVLALAVWAARSRRATGSGNRTPV